MHDYRYIPIFDISIQLNLYRYCITGLVYHDMAIYRYIVTRGVPIIGSAKTSATDIANSLISVDSPAIYRYCHVRNYYSFNAFRHVVYSEVCFTTFQL